MEHMRQFLWIYIQKNVGPSSWMVCSTAAAKVNERGTYRAEKLRQWTRAFIADRRNLPVRRKATWNASALENEDLRSALTTHLQSLGPHIRALDVFEYLADEEVQKEFGLKSGICLSTAQGWMQRLEYRWKPIPNGQYVDGHEREDVVQYRQDEYLPALAKLYPGLTMYNNDGTEHIPFGPQLLAPRRIIIWWHDESTFYANDRRKVRWVHVGEKAVPRQKGEGVSLMISDFFSAEFGWLRYPDHDPMVDLEEDHDTAARKLFKAGKNRDGYFTHEDVIAQALKAAAIVKACWPEYDHVFIFDNAPTHSKRPDDALSARHMPKGRSDPKKKNRKGEFRKNFGVQVNVVGENGKPVYGPDGNILKMFAPMTGAWYVDQETGEIVDQDMYFAHDHPDEDLRGLFKGMATVLEERGYTNAKTMLAECDGFHCPPPPPNWNQPEERWYLNNLCCCRRLLYCQPDFQQVKSMLETELEALGIRCIFLPKFHCELNPIEQCWCYSKREYRKLPASKEAAQLAFNLVSSIEKVPQVSMRR
jgi:hypothetical protein